MFDDNNASIRVMLIDDHRSVLWGLEKLIDSQYPVMGVVGKFTSFAEASTQLKKLSPDIIMLDLDLGHEQGVDVIPQLVELSEARILILTGSRDSELQDKAIIAGAKGILEKEYPPETILTAIAKVHAGELWIDKERVGRIILELSREKSMRDNDPERKKISSLTPRELTVVKEVTSQAGSTGSQVAKQLHIGDSTLRNHLSSIYSKLEVSNRLELWDFAHKHGLGKEKK
jgi:DNA-binding NarL/FixJ family response regulator